VQLEEVIESSFTPLTVKHAWERSGMVPYDISKILSGCTIWSTISTENAQGVVNAILEILVPLCKIQGFLHDSQIEDACKDFITFNDATRKKDDCADHYRRCLWMNSDGFCENHRRKVAAKEADESAKAVVAAEKAAKRRRIEEKEAEKAATLEDLVAAGQPVPKSFKLSTCSNPLCNEYVYHAGIHFGGWVRCANRGCDKIFCPAADCQSLLESHAAICFHG